MDSENNVILPVSYPVITTYTQHAHILSILSPFKQTYPWIISNYINLYINKDYIYDWGDFYFPFPYETRPSDSCKWLQIQKIHKTTVNKKWGNIIALIIESINSNNYVHVMINSYYIPNYVNYYQKKDFKHDILVYGFDISEEKLYVADFFNHGKYSFEKVAFSDFAAAFTSYNSSRYFEYLNGMVTLYKVNDSCDYTFDIRNITYSLKSYLSSRILEYWDIYNRDNRSCVVFGCDIYETLINYIYAKLSKGETDINKKPFYMLYDHKKMMLFRIMFLLEEGYIKNQGSINYINAFKEIENQALVVTTLVIKYSMNGNKAVVERAINMLNEIKKAEKEVLKALIDGLEIVDTTE